MKRNGVIINHYGLESVLKFYVIKWHDEKDEECFQYNRFCNEYFNISNDYFAL